MLRSLADFYVQRGFRVYADAYSEYLDSNNSIANLLNFTSRDLSDSHLAEPKPRRWILKESAYFLHLARLGYRLHVYQPDYVDFCRVPGIVYSSCLNYNGRKAGFVHLPDLGTIERAEFLRNTLFGGSGYLRRARELYGRVRRSIGGTALPEWVATGVAPISVLPVFRQLERDLRSASPGEAYFAHLLIPHHPYILDASCRPRPQIEEWLYNSAPLPPSELVRNTDATRAERYRRYFDQIRCSQRLLDGVFRTMEKAGLWQVATVIIHGDHGSRIMRRLPIERNAPHLGPGDFLDGFSTLFAVRAPGGQGGVVPGARSLQHLLGEVFNVPVDDLPHKVYLRANGKTLKAHDLVGLSGGVPERVSPGAVPPAADDRYNRSDGPSGFSRPDLP